MFHIRALAAFWSTAVPMPLHSSAQRKAMMSVIAIFRQQSSREADNFLTLIDLTQPQS